jgi:peptidyl-prolyl cis-trans isomerase D
MMSRLRKMLDNWIVRVFLVLLFGVFVFWGISNVVTMVGSNSAVAHVNGKPVDISVLQAEYQKELNQYEQSNPGQPDLPAREKIAQAAMTMVLRQQVLAVAERSLGVSAPDSAVRQSVYAIPAFQSNGVFDKAKFAQVLQENSLSPEEFLVLVKNDMTNQQLVQAVISGVAAPAALNNQIFSFVSEQRIAASVSISASAQKPPPLPPDAVLQRYWRNHPADFTAPQYRTAKIVILSPQTLAPQQPVSDAEIAALYARTSAQQSVQASRSVQVISAGDAASAAKLAALWKAGASWKQMQAAAAKAGDTAVELDNSQPEQIPNPALAQAVFAATPNVVTGPIQGALGFFLFNVTHAVAAGAPPLAQLAAQLKQQIQLQKAQAAVNQDVDNVQDALAGQTPLDQLPGNLGLVAVEGTLDANGNTADGSTAPIPGDSAQRAAIISAIFAAQPGTPAQLITGPDGGYFAFTVDQVTPPAVQPYDLVRQKVEAAWIQDALQREAEVKAANLLNAVNSGQSLDATASAAGYAVTLLPPVTRNAPPSGVSTQLAQIIFSLKPGQATMLQTADGFTVAALSDIHQPTPAQDPADFGQVAQAMTKSMQDDTAASFIAGLQARYKVTVDNKLFNQVYQ